MFRDYIKRKIQLPKINYSSTSFLLASSDLNTKELIKIIDDSGKTVQLFNPESIISRMHVIGSYLNALSSFESKQNISKSVAVEILLFAAQTRQINLAIEKIGVQSNRQMLVFAENDAALEPIKKYLNNEKPFSPDEKHRKRAATKLGLDPNISDIALLQAIAISRLSY